MRIIQIIDSLEAGGAERMAVNYANALSSKIEFSGLIATRKQGVLAEQLDSKVSYLFLNKSRKLDVNAIWRLKKYVQQNKITVIQAHSSSFFIAVLIKLLLPKIKIIWHDHYGISQDLSTRKNWILKLGSVFFSGIISVNSSLKKWAESYLFCTNIIYLSNFINEDSASKETLSLKGNAGKRIVCVANLRPQKNHKMLIEAANKIKEVYPDWSFHLFGKDFDDAHSKEIREKIKDLKLQNIFFYGSVTTVSKALDQSEIAVLPSLSEGLPLAILEYGLHKLPVLATNVGEISKVISSHKEGLVVESDDLQSFTAALLSLIKEQKFREELGLELYKKIQAEYSEQTIIKEYLLWLDCLVNFVPVK